MVKEMKKINIIFSMLLAAVVSFSCVQKEPDYSQWYGTDEEENQGSSSNPGTSAGEMELSVMSFNVRYPAAADTGEKAWSNRSKGVYAMIKAKQPMLIGVQECYISQRNDIVNNCEGYSAYGVGRDNGTTSGETTSILYQKSLFSLKEYGTFWLSETPNTPSTGWDASIKRTATWVKLEMKSNGQQFYFVNTHLDHQGATAKAEGLKLIQQKINDMNQAGLPVILTGDFNELSSSSIFNTLTLKNVRNEAPITDNFGTSNGYGDQNKQIDHIYFGGSLNPLTYETIRDRWEGITYISDHYPIMATFNFQK